MIDHQKVCELDARGEKLILEILTGTIGTPGEMFSATVSLLQDYIKAGRPVGNAQFLSLGMTMVEFVRMGGQIAVIDPPESTT